MVRILIIGEPGTGRTQFVKGIKTLAESILAATGNNHLTDVVKADIEPLSRQLKPSKNTKLVIMSTTPAKLREVGIEPYL